MIKQLPNKPILPKKLKKKINKLKPLKGNEWNSGAKDIKVFKSLIKKQLLVIQDDKCAYCGLKLKETSRIEIEHIAPKGGIKQPQHTELAFTTINLVLACNLCNCTENKGTFDTIKTKNINYSLSEFKIVHPYLDDHDKHYGWETNEENEILIIGKSEEGKKSIDLFSLNSSDRTEARAKLKLYEYIKTLPQADDLFAASVYGLV